MLKLKVICRADDDLIGSENQWLYLRPEDEKQQYLPSSTVGEYPREVTVEFDPDATKDHPDGREEVRIQLRDESNGAAVRGLTLYVPRNHGGKTGIKRIQLSAWRGNIEYPFDVLLPAISSHLEQARFEAMLDDLRYWIDLSIAGDVERALEYDEDTDQPTPGLAALKLLERQVEELQSALDRIEQMPRRRLDKEYYRTAGTPPRQDATTLRANALQINPTRSHTFRYESSLDTYENRFLLHLIDLLSKPLPRLRAQALGTMRRCREKYEEEKSYLERKKRKGEKITRKKREVDDLRNTLAQAEALRGRVQNIGVRLQRARSKPFLQEARYDPGQFRMTFPLSLVQDSRYAPALELYNRARKTQRLRRISRADRFLEGVVEAGVRLTRKLYEYWVFFATYEILLECDFEAPDMDENGALLSLIDDSLTPGLKSDSFVKLRGTGRLSHVDIKLWYEKKFLIRDSTGGLTKVAEPDVLIEGVVRGNLNWQFRFALDAKYRTFEEREKEKSSDAKAFRDARDQIESKYQPLNTGGKVDKSRGAFIAHVNESDGNLKDFGIDAYRNNHAKWYGWIPLLPRRTSALEELIEEKLLRRRLNLL